MATYTKEDAARVSEQVRQDFINGCATDNDALIKRGADIIDKYTKVYVREECLVDRIIEPETITDYSLFDRETHTESPSIVVEKEPWSPPAMTFGFTAQFAPDFYLKGSRYRIPFQRYETRRFRKDTTQLLTWRMDIRRMFSANALYDLIAARDYNFITATNRIVMGVDVTSPVTGAVQHTQSSGGISRETLNYALMTMSKNDSNLQPVTVVINLITARYLAMLGREEIGGDVAQEFFLNGWVNRDFLGVKWLVSIKKDLIPTKVMFQYASSEYIGRSFELSPPTMHIERKAYDIRFMVFGESGIGIGNMYGIVRHDFN